MNIKLWYVTYFQGEFEDCTCYPHVTSCLVVSSDEVLIQYIDGLGSCCIRRLKIDDDHQIKMGVNFI